MARYRIVETYQDFRGQIVDVDELGRHWVRCAGDIAGTDPVKYARSNGYSVEPIVDLRDRKKPKQH